ncbi:hypothetical protein EB796_022712 [Bugula neritina]|uniref:Uncharacterized protein n=1 Tax=Bugula neritina TaxID=10212 RepID=A0A7J7IZH7_BUGNE|nr:hypothetical protein EB796_022712 [Bugula neritina]
MSPVETKEGKCRSSSPYTKFLRWRAVASMFSIKTILSFIVMVFSPKNGAKAKEAAMLRDRKLKMRLLRQSYHLV